MERQLGRPARRARRRDRVRPAHDRRPADAGGGPGRQELGLALAFAWAAYPYTLFALDSNSNDSLVAAVVVWALVLLRSPPPAG